MNNWNCKSCIFGRKINGELKCIKLPPVVIAAGDNNGKIVTISSVFPRTEENWACGQWEEIPPGPERVEK